MGVTDKDRAILDDSVAVKIMVELKFYILFGKMRLTYVCRWT